LNYHRLQAGGFSTPLKWAKRKQKHQEILVRVKTASIMTQIRYVIILRLKARILNTERDNNTPITPCGT
jgi:hypothetical protein